MKSIEINGVKIMLDNIVRIEVEENFDGQGERLLLFSESSEDPLELVVYDASSMRDKIEEIIST
jgi:hypothetical protein